VFIRSLGSHQDRIAQKAFRLRQRVHHTNLQNKIIQKASRIQAISRNNIALLETMNHLQKENIKVSPACTFLSVVEGMAINI
jgi:hypothetical protein